jgi:hypothetical protein
VKNHAAHTLQGKGPAHRDAVHEVRTGVARDAARAPEHFRAVPCVLLERVLKQQRHGPRAAAALGFRQVFDLIGPQVGLEHFAVFRV